MDAALVKSWLKQTKVLIAPKHALATFGATHIQYHLISPVEDLQNKTRLREGTVVSHRPKILTPESFAQRFEGFGPEAHEAAQWLASSYGDLLRALEYNFKNSELMTRVISESPRTVAERIIADQSQKENRDAAVIRCPDAAWSLALIKLTLDESSKSFPVHVRDLERRGMFNPAAHEEDRRRREIEQLFKDSARDHQATKTLGEKLHEYGLFSEYEDRFLSLF